MNQDNGVERESVLEKKYSSLTLIIDNGKYTLIKVQKESTE